MNTKDVINLIGAFIEKYHLTNKVELPDFNFKIKRIDNVKIHENSLKEFREIVTFTGTAHISYVEINSNIGMTKDFTLIGNATYAENEQFIQSVVITQVKRIKKW